MNSRHGAAVPALLQKMINEWHFPNLPFFPIPSSGGAGRSEPMQSSYKNCFALAKDAAEGTRSAAAVAAKCQVGKKEGCVQRSSTPFPQVNCVTERCWKGFVNPASGRACVFRGAFPTPLSYTVYIKCKANSQRSAFLVTGRI